MEDVPPSYQSAIDREAWNVIAPWIPSSDLCSACLVSRKWHSIFIPSLWGDPASHFGIKNDEVYVALTRFKRTLRKARASVRQLTHTLHLPPAVSEIYGGPNPTWLRDILEYLPNLQSLIVSKLPFFDHHSLLALRSNNQRGPADEEILPSYGLKLLLAANEPNLTSVGLACGIPRFSGLVYLDLSYTSPAKDASVLSSLSALHDLQVLKLRGVGIRDGEAEVLANAIGIRVRLLDLRENMLTDMAVRSLLQACFYPSLKQSNGPSMNSRRVEDWPVGMAPGPDFFSLDTLRNEELDHELLKQLTNPLTGRLAFEDIPHRGLTHLYIADNRLSVEGLSSLLKSERLHILDGGSVDTVKTISRTKSLSSSSGYTDEVRFPGAEKLIPVLAEFARKNLTYLRVDHAIVTETLDVPKSVPAPPKLSAIELPGTQPLASELAGEDRNIVEAPADVHYAVEMPVEVERYELDASEPMLRFELPGDIIHFTVSPPIGEKPGPSRPQSALLQAHRGSGVFAPEVVTNGNESSQEVSPTSNEEEDEDEVVLNASGTGMKSKKSVKYSTIKSEVGTDSTASTHASTPISPIGETLPPRSQAQYQVQTQPQTPNVPAYSASRHGRIDTLLHKRPAAMTSNEGQGITDPSVNINTKLLSSLHPAILPNLRTLILTGVPSSVPESSPILNGLKNFISACADEDSLAHLRAQTNYSLPPGRARKDAETHHARSQFALRQIMLEIAPAGQTQSARERLMTKGWKHLRQRHSMSKSSTGDHDSENLWSAAADDFSFFGEEGEEKDENGIYEHDREKYFPTAHMDDKIAVSPYETRDDVLSSSPHGSVSSLNSSRALQRSPTVLRSPRELPMGRNRRSSSSASNRPSIRYTAEMQGSVPMSQPGQQIAVQYQQQQPPPAPANDEIMVDLVAELAKWRRERKAAYEEALIRWRTGGSLPRRGEVSSIASRLNSSPSVNRDERDMPFVEGHWKGDIKVVRNAAPKGRGGVVDVYGNYFEKGYLYP